MENNSLKTIYFDEAGYTGGNLLDSNQPFFCFAGFQLEDEEINEFSIRISELKSNYKIQGNELKGSRLCNSYNGQEFIKQIVSEYKPRAKIIFHEKDYAFAAKFYEYIFEPILAEKSSYFYRTNFHKFITTHLYLYYKAKGHNYEKLIMDIQEFFKKNGDYSIFKDLIIEERNNFVIHTIVDFARREYGSSKKRLERSEISKWTLELSSTSIVCFLRNWVEDSNTRMRVICDESKPILAIQDFLNAFVGKNENIYTDIFGKRVRLSYNLDRPIEFKASKESIGLQLSDLFASSFNYALKNGEENFSEFVIKELENVVSTDFCVGFDQDMDVIHFKDEGGNNIKMLYKINEISKRNEDIIRGLEKYILY